MPYIYKVTNLLNQKIYIGKTMSTVEKRWKEHIKDAQRFPERPLYRAMLKYGVENFSIEEIEECSHETVNERETHWIEVLSSFRKGYNATLGGDGKHYLDYDLIYQTYLEIKSCSVVAQMLEIDSGTVSRIVKIYGEDPSKNSKALVSNKVAMIDKKSDVIIMTFSSQMEAARYLIENSHSNIADSRSLASKISLVCREKRKSCAGFKWKLLQ